MDYLDELKKQIQQEHEEKVQRHKELIESPQYIAARKFLDSYTWDMIQAVRSVSIYSTRARHIYDNCLFIHSIDDLLQSFISIKFQVENGVFNSAKRELRYILELSVKNSVVDSQNPNSNLQERIKYLHDNIPRSSIQIAEQLSPILAPADKKEFLAEINLHYSQICEYIHPSKKQIEEQIFNYSKGNTIGFESAKMLESTNSLIFKVYDIILVLLFSDFGPSMSKDLYEELFCDNPKWKFHKGKHCERFKKHIRAC